MSTQRDSRGRPPGPVEPPGSQHEGATGFSAWLMTHLKARRMSQRQLAQRSGIDHSSISRLSRGGRTPSLQTAERLARALGVEEPIVGDGDSRLLRTPRQSIDPIGGVERALRADDQLTEGDIGRLMQQYLALRRDGVDRAASPPRPVVRRDAVLRVAAVSRASRAERPAGTTAERTRARLG